MPEKAYLSQRTVVPAFKVSLSAVLVEIRVVRHGYNKVIDVASIHKFPTVRGEKEMDSMIVEIRLQAQI